MEPFLREEVKKALAIDNVQNAIWYGQRLCATADSEENILLLARAYVRNSQDYRAMELLQKVEQLSPIGGLLLAECMFRLKNDKVELLIIQAKEDAEKKAKNTPDHSAENYVLAEICLLHGLLYKRNTRSDQAIEQFRKALSHNPFLWPAHEHLCNLGADAEVKSHLDDLKEKFTEDLSEGGNASPSLPERTRAGGSLRSRAPKTPVETRGAVVTRRSLGRGVGDRAGKLQKVNNAAESNPDLMEGVTSTEDSIYYSASEQTSAESSNPSRMLQRLGLENEVSGLNGLTSHLQIAQQTSNAGFKQFCQFLHTISEGINDLANCRQKEALKSFNSLPGSQRNTPWIQAKLGILATQKGKYSEARDAFSKALDLDPTHVEDMDHYSSVLFLLGDTPRLNSLSTKMVELDRLIPQTWCAVGNAHCASRDHRTALDAFKRGVQMDPSKAYCYTLCGHAQLAMDDHSKAREFFRQAVCLDRRHHSGWYGIGLVEFHTENYAAAAYNFGEAVGIVPTQAVLRLQFGRALAKIGKVDEAEKQFKASRGLDKKNKSACLEQGKLYLDNKRFEDAKRAFQDALNIDARDPNSFYHFGLACKRLRSLGEATSAFYNALDLQPETVLEANIRAALDRINQDDDEPHRKY